MNDRIQELLSTIRQLEHELMDEFQKKGKEYRYEIKNKRVYFEEEIKKQNRLLIKKIRYYLKEVALMNIITSLLMFNLVPGCQDLWEERKSKS